ncbi:right-handed parallel beta-helix repeat-containing protein [Oceanirhabdus seepicola]|uniref:Right-handed parallel beta-helix repeat-containing protein n=1 Tax=Oceanirhabdus seepicola TaxID=2828781 RepID=A0A9J6NZC2_9CLOT|nr:right-handed parallel beta-helix repeat-containing protein [Oceanirhabdus seepicola]MCM1988949.1 right-handed parallel beta-helix repeat-containing protein [Oceanirhabdus seepicola]
MKLKKRFITVLLLMVFFMETIAFADIPAFTVVIGDKGYSLEQLHKGIGSAEIKKGQPIYIKSTQGKWIDTKSGKEVDKNIIPQVTYFDEYGNKVVYEKHDGDIIKEVSEKMYFELFITKNKSGLGQVISLNMTPEGYSEYFNVNYFQLVDKENKNITEILELGKVNYIYPDIEAKKVSINLYDFSKEKIVGIKEVTIKEDEKIFISENKIAENEVITVSSSEELVAALGSHRTIRLKKGKYDLLNYDKKGSCVRYGQVFDGLEIIFSNIVDMTLEGEEGVELYVDPRYANVMNFNSCSRINFKNLTIGHTRGKGYCTGGVLKFDYCEKINIENCVLYGCGTEGLTITGTNDIFVKDSIIEECSYGIMTIDNSSNISFENSIFRNNKEFHGAIINTCNNVKFNECIFENNEAKFDEFISGYGAAEGAVTIENCTFTKNDSKAFIDENYKKCVVLKNNKFEKNSFEIEGTVTTRKK